MTKLEVGQVVLVVDKGFSVGDPYKDGDLLLITEVARNGLYYVGTNHRTGGRDCRVIAREVTLMERILVKITERGVGDIFSVGNSLPLFRKVGGWDMTGYFDNGELGAYRIEAGKFEVVVPVPDVSPVGKEIEFKDIRIGDRIRSEIEYEGTSVVMEGVVEKIVGYGCAGTSDGIIIATLEAATASVSSRLVLVDRPEVNEFAEAPVGAVAVRKEMLFYKVGVNDWKAIKADGKWSAGYSYTDTDFGHDGILYGADLTFPAPSKD